MLWQKRDFHLHFRDLCGQQLLSEAGVVECCVSQAGHPYSARFMELPRLWDTSSHFFFF